MNYISAYTVSYIEYANLENIEKDKPAEQKAFEASTDKGGLYGQKAISTTQGDFEFYPLIGGSFNLEIKDADNNSQNLTINIPPIPLEYLKIESSDKQLEPSDLLKIITNYYTFGGKSLASGVSLKLELAKGINKGKNIYYNPENSRSNNAPNITLPVLINPNSDFLYEFD